MCFVSLVFFVLQALGSSSSSQEQIASTHLTMFFQICEQCTECSRDTHSVSRSHGLLKNAHLACILGFKGFKVCNALTIK